MEHYKNLLSALAGAMPVCMVWLLAGTEDDYFNARDVFAFALSEGGEEEELDEGQFYVVSAEGAIGLAVNYEYLTRWIFIPVDDKEITERELERMREELAYDREHENDEPEQEDTEAEGLYEAEAGTEEDQSVAPLQEIPPQPVMPQQSQPIPPQPVMPQQSQPIPPQPVMPQQSQLIPPQPIMPQQSQQPVPPQSGQKRFCIQCGFQIKATAKFCPKCGNPVQR